MPRGCPPSARSALASLRYSPATPACAPLLTGDGQFLARLHHLPRCAALDAPLAKRILALLGVRVLGGVQLLGSLPRSPFGLLIGSMTSTTSSNAFESCAFAVVRTTVSGTPAPSATRWRFEPGFPRSVGFGRRLRPLWPPDSPGRAGPRTSRSYRLLQACRGVPDATCATPQILPSLAGAASRCSPSRSHLRGEHLPREAAVEDEDDAGERCPVGHAGSSTLRLWHLRW